MKKYIKIKNLIMFIIYFASIPALQVAAFHSQILSNSKYSQNTLNVKTKIVLKILLVEFQDVKHRNPNYPSKYSLPAYTFEDFENMLFSKNKYISPLMYSPDGEKVFGSLTDYYNIMSNGKLEITGFILNYDMDEDNVPDWIQLDHNKSYYHNKRGKEFRAEARKKAKELRLDISNSQNEFLVIIYAGHTYRIKCNTLNPEAFRYEQEYIMGERFAAGSPYCEERDNPNKNSVSTFAHIGIHAHELGHLFGFEDLRGGVENYEWCLMSSGNYNGPHKGGACPAPINPYYRWLLNWTSFKIINEASTERLSYSLKSPVIYKLQDSLSSSFFLVEFRKFIEKMRLGNIEIADYNSFIPGLKEKQGLLIWRKLTGKYMKLLFANGEEGSNLNEHIFPGRLERKVITPWSDTRESIPGSYWVPNTKPSLNCGIEIIKICADYCEVDLYQKYSVKASPSFPKDLNFDIGREISLSWANNIEPDISHYRIYKYLNNKYIFYDSSFSNNYLDKRENRMVFDRINRELKYKITAVDNENNESTYSTELNIPLNHRRAKKNVLQSRQKLQFQNYPNPFNNSTTISFLLDKSDKVSLVIYNILGEEVAVLINEIRSPGTHKIYCNLSDFQKANASGIYIFRLTFGNHSYIIKGQLLK